MLVYVLLNFLNVSMEVFLLIISVYMLPISSNCSQFDLFVQCGDEIMSTVFILSTASTSRHFHFQNSKISFNSNGSLFLSTMFVYTLQIFSNIPQSDLSCTILGWRCVPKFLYWFFTVFPAGRCVLKFLYWFFTVFQNSVNVPQLDQW